MTAIEDIFRSNRTEIICAATAAAGPNATKEAIGERIRAILELHNEGDPTVSNVLYQVQREAEQVGELKRFVGTIIHLDKELSSNRAVVVLQVGDSKSRDTQHAGGLEAVRTARLDSGDHLAQTAAEIARRIQGSDETPGLVGHKVLVTIGLASRDGQKYRTLVDVQDKGVDNNYNPNDPRYRLNRRLKVDYGKWANASQMQIEN